MGLLLGFEQPSGATDSSRGGQMARDMCVMPE